MTKAIKLTITVRTVAHAKAILDVVERLEANGGTLPAPENDATDRPAPEVVRQAFEVLTGGPHTIRLALDLAELLDAQPAEAAERCTA